MHDLNRFVACLTAVSCLGLSGSLVAQPEHHSDLAAYPAVSHSPGDAAVNEHVSYAYAQVLRVEPVYQDVRVPRPIEQCEDYERVERTRPPSAGGTVLGAIIGGVIGNQVGSGSGRRAATAAGAVIGGAVGYEAGRETRVEPATRCHVEDGYVLEQQVVGYDVEYRYRGEVYMSRLANDPGDRLRIRVAVAPAETATAYDARPANVEHY